MGLAQGHPTQRQMSLIANAANVKRERRSRSGNLCACSAWAEEEELCRARRGLRRQWAQHAAAIISHCITLIRFYIYDADSRKPVSLLRRETVPERDLPPSLTSVCLRQAVWYRKRPNPLVKLNFSPVSGRREEDD